MKKTALCFGLLILLNFSVRAQDTTYYWTGTEGFTAMITLDSPSSTDGSLSDIVSIYAQDPDQYGPFANYPVTMPWGTVGPDEFDSTDATLNPYDWTTPQPFTWDPTEITSMDLQWTLGGDLWTFFVGQEEPSARPLDVIVTPLESSIDFYNGDGDFEEYDNTGLYQGQSSSAPDGGSTVLLLGGALVAISIVLRKPPVPARVIVRRQSR